MSTAISHWYEGRKAQMTHDARVALVKKYLENPKAWPDGIESKNDGRWYTSNKDYWHALARGEKPPAPAHD